jgi:hypothetical protein
MTGTNAKTTITERWSRANGGVERRATPREQVLLPALIVEAGGRRRACVILDRSEGGLRISVPTDEAVPDAFCILDLVTGVGREVEVAWRRAPELGLRTLRAYDLDHPQEGVGEALRQIWIAVLG